MPDSLGPKSILTIDDEAYLRDAIVGFLEDRDYRVLEAADGVEGLEVFRREAPDLVLTDLRMPRLDGLSVVRTLHEEAPDTPVIVISGTGALTDAVAALRAGAWDYLVKPIHDLGVLQHTVEGCLERARLLQENRRYQNELEALVEERTGALGLRERELQQIFDTTTDALVVVAEDLGVLRVNQAATALVGAPADQLVGRPCTECFPTVLCGTPSCPVKRCIATGRPAESESVVAAPGQAERICVVRALPMPPGSDGRRRVLEVLSDVTERRRLEDRLRQSEKLDALGQLAGGVAHDFNNLLGAILGSAEMVRAELSPGSEGHADLDQIVSTVERAAALNQQLLTFARKTERKRTPFDLNTVVDEVVDLLAHTVDRRITMTRRLGRNLPTTLGDVAQLHAALTNLAVNARDAMPDGGTITFATRRCVVEPEEGCPDALAPDPGDYLEVSVSDTGTGISREMRERIFEPFFTTKAKGKGTGLGLAMVYGTAKDHGGGLFVESELGQGSTFRVLLPVAESTQVPRASLPEQEPARAAGCVLIADDEESLRDVVSRHLARRGYTVLVAADGEEAVDVFRDAAGSVDLLILDMVMPRASGVEALRRIRSIDPAVPAIVCSGYAAGMDAATLRQEEIAELIDKPVRMDHLAARVARWIRRRPVADG